MRIVVRSSGDGDGELDAALSALNEAVLLQPGARSDFETITRRFQTVTAAYLARDRPIGILATAGSIARFAREVEDDRLEMEALYWVGRAYLEFHMSLDAIQRLDRASALAERVERPYWRDRIRLALASAWMQSGDPLRAQGILSSDIMPWERVAESASESDPGLRLAWVVAKAAAVAASQQYYRACVLLMAVLDDWPADVEGKHGAELHLAACRARLGDTRGVGELLNRAATGAEEEGDTRGYICALDERALWRARSGELAEAGTDWDRAIEVMEGRVARTTSEEFRIAFRTAHQHLYERAMTCAFQRGDYEGAWRYGERSQGRLFLKLLRHPEIVRVWFENREKERRYLDATLDLEALREALRRELRGRRRRPHRVRRLRRLQEERRAQKTEFLRHLRAVELSARVDMEGVPARRPLNEDELAVEDVVGVDETREALAGDLCILRFHVTRDRVLSFCLSREGVEPAVYSVPAVVLEDQVRSFRSLVGGRSAPDQLHSIDALGAVLAHGLIEPFQRVLQACSTIAIVADGPLHALPFAAILPESVRCTTDVVFAPSVSALLSMLDLPPKSISGPVLALVNPEPREAPLPYAEDEAAVLSEVFPDVTAFRGRKATGHRLRTLAGHASILHIACHAEFNAQDPLLSQLRLASDTRRGDPGVIDAFQLQDLQLRAGLVVLSACETGLAGVGTSGELPGLVRSFFLGGASTVIASLWRVDDRATSHLMRSMYEALERNPAAGKAAALRAGQEELWSTERYAAPHYWAGFQLYGDWRVAA